MKYISLSDKDKPILLTTGGSAKEYLIYGSVVIAFAVLFFGLCLLFSDAQKVFETFSIYGLLILFVLPLVAGTALFSYGVWLFYDASKPKIVATNAQIVIHNKGKYLPLEYSDIADVWAEYKVDKKGTEVWGHIFITTKEQGYKFKTHDTEGLKKFIEKSTAAREQGGFLKQI